MERAIRLAFLLNSFSTIEFYYLVASQPNREVPHYRADRPTDTNICDVVLGRNVFVMCWHRDIMLRAIGYTRVNNKNNFNVLVFLFIS